jgi:hypothetical protein
MDVYGAFQICAIGILAAPVTVRLSSTYFYDRGRNLIFVWTGLLLAGLLSLTVEFYKIQPKDCHGADQGTFQYGDDGELQCGLNCAGTAYSPMRQGSAKDINTIPVPDVLNIGTTMLISAACCVPAVLSMVSMWNKILEINWKKRFGLRDSGDVNDELIEGTNGATITGMKNLNNRIRIFLRNAVEAPVFGAAIMAILIKGEMNFNSDPVKYDTEPMQSIGTSSASPPSPTITAPVLTSCCS